MPKKAPELSAALVRRLKRPGLHAVGGVDGLHLRIKPTGASSWMLRVKVGNRRPDIGLGGFPDVTLEQARQRAREARELIRQGIDPRDEKRKARDALAAAEAKRLTFARAAVLAHSARAPEFRNPKHAAQWITSLERHAFPTLGHLQVDAIELAQVFAALEPIWRTRTETASRVRGRIEDTLSWATVNGYRTGPNPAAWSNNLEHALPRVSRVKKVQHRVALSWKLAPEFMHRLRANPSTSARAIEFLILTAARSQEVRLATWDELDFDARVWTVPASHMKAGKVHRVPLSDAALDLLRALPRHHGTDLVFPGAQRGRPMSDSTLSKFLREMLQSTSWTAQVHGFRSTFKDWARSCTAYADEVSELALAHVSTDATRAAYARDELLPKRAKLMRDWAKHLEAAQAASASVVPMRSRS